MKKLFLGLLACVSVAVFAIACGGNNNNNPQPVVGAGYCANQPNTVWNGTTCVYNANCVNQPGTVWNGTTCAVNPYGNQYGYPNQYGNQYGYNSSCTGGMVYTYQGCLPQGSCPIGQALYGTQCVPAMSTNGGWGTTGYPQGYPTAYPQIGYPQVGYGYPNYYYPTYYSAPRAGLYFYGRVY